MSAKRKDLPLWERAAKHGWIYEGDMSIECGGMFWKNENDTDYVPCVEINPCSDAGGPDNLWEVVTGSVYLTQDVDQRNSMLDIIGWNKDFIGPYELTYLVMGAKAYWGMEADTYGRCVVRIGARDRDYERPGKWRKEGWNPEPDVILPGNARLDNYIFREFVT